MQFSRHNLLMTDYVFLRIIQLRLYGFQFVLFLKLPSAPYGITSNNCHNVVSPIYTLFVILFWYSKYEIPGVALELWQLKLKQFSPDILKFSTKHEDNPFTLNFFMVPCTCLFIFGAGSLRLGSNNFRNSRYKEKTAGSTRVSRLSFPFL